jgi:hypothetical protein
MTTIDQLNAGRLGYLPRLMGIEVISIEPGRHSDRWGQWENDRLIPMYAIGSLPTPVILWSSKRGTGEDRTV